MVKTSASSSVLFSFHGHMLSGALYLLLPSELEWGASPGPLCSDPPRPPSDIFLVAFICLFGDLSPLLTPPFHGHPPPSLPAYPSTTVEHDSPSGVEFSAPRGTPA